MRFPKQVPKLVFVVEKAFVRTERKRGIIVKIGRVSESFAHCAVASRKCLGHFRRIDRRKHRDKANVLLLTNAAHFVVQRKHAFGRRHSRADGLFRRKPIVVLVLVDRRIADAHYIVYAAKNASVGKILHRKSTLRCITGEKIARRNRKEQNGRLTGFHRKIEQLFGFRKVSAARW